MAASSVVPEASNRRPRVADLLLGLRAKLADWAIAPGEIESLEETIGIGSTSVVYKGKLRGVPQAVAVKEITLSTIEEQYSRETDGTVIAITRELEVWPAVRHPGILKFLGFSFTPDERVMRICSQFCTGGTLFDLLHNCWDIELSNLQKRKMLLDIARAVDYLHNFQQPVMHRDLKSLNIFLLEPVVDRESEIHVKLADFGFARKPEDDLTNGAGTPHWMAPEVAQGTVYHLKVDVFSFAVIMYEVVCRHMAFETLTPEQAKHEIAQGHRPTLEGACGTDTFVPENTPNELRALIARCWSQNALDRPSMDDVVQELERLEWPEDGGG